MRTIASVLQDVRANGLRSVITAASIIVGVLALIGTTLVGLIAQDVFIAKEEQRSAREATVRVDLGADPHPTAAAIDLWTWLSERFEGTDHNAVVLWTGQGVVTDSREDVTVVGVLGEYGASRRLPFVEGASPASSASADVAAGAPRQVSARAAVLNEQVGGSAEALTLRLPGVRPEVEVDVAGVVSDAESSGIVYLPVGAWEAPRVAQQIGADSPTVLVTVGADQVDAARALVETWAARSGAAQAPDMGRLDTVATVRDQLKQLTTLFSVVAIVALVLSALGILNIGLASVSHRTRELAIRRSLGATPADLFGLVLGSALAAGLVAALISLAAAWAALTFGLPHWVPAESAVTVPHLPASTVLLALGAALGTSLLGAALPAWRAARIEIASVLRD